MRENNTQLQQNLIKIRGGETNNMERRFVCKSRARQQKVKLIGLEKRHNETRNFNTEFVFKGQILLVQQKSIEIDMLSPRMPAIVIVATVFSLEVSRKFIKN